MGASDCSLFIQPGWKLFAYRPSTRVDLLASGVEQEESFLGPLTQR